MYMRRRVVGDALALIDAMKQQHVVLDVKVYTTIAFIHASQGDLLAVVQVVKEMTSHDVAVDDIFFDYVVNAVYGSCGLDMCFSLLREFSRQDLPIPEGLYRSGSTLGSLNARCMLRTIWNATAGGFPRSCCTT
ncbi:hypothetical protein PsorP6_009636 [Peronosclerospora sorghi]|uniref:Uncharacterized protein n=1 Tax=Peronosclerospora sorghi TaxID=230839 RepID=A0ACC0W1T9_9STRA|nr:hypothetical protein PsorP6_009636 [Peronosclerospora sorghi]